MRRKRHRGFTLVELLIAIVIIGILCSMAVIRYMNLQDKSRVAAATFDLDLMRKLLAIYATDYGAYPTAAASYADLKSQLVDPQGNTYGVIPVSNTFQWNSYQLDPEGEYIIQVTVPNRSPTTLVVTPDRITRQ
ncbi:MAG: prepilin-type N-terminal cleavage/methylation domain-containing protein [bacterium]|nr:prepilin-type N-terminal cleavage/methylation domain-containing protein [bacterium]